MPRGGLSVAILAQLNKTAISGGVFYGLRITRSTGNLYWAERDMNIPSVAKAGPAYVGKILDLSSLDFTPGNQSTTLTVTVENVNGDVTVLDHAESFSGCKVEVLEYYPDADDYSIRWIGYFDEITELSGTRAILTAYGDAPSTRIQIPKRTVTLQCSWQFGRSTAWVSNRDFDGAECPYQRTGSIGFVASLVGSISAGQTAITVNLDAVAGQFAAGFVFQISDRFKIDGETVQVAATGVISGSNHQDLTVTRGVNSVATAHSDGATVLFANCQFSSTACRRRGMYGNNPADTFAYGSLNISRNYFGGFPMITAYEYGRFLTKTGSRPAYHLLEFGGQASSYGHPLPLPYGRSRITDCPIILAKPEGAYQVTLWAIAPGLLGTNAIDDVQTDAGRTGQLPGGIRPLDAYSRDDYPDYVMQVNGGRRHDPTHDSNGVPFGVEAYNGQQDQHEPGGPSSFFGTNSFFPTVNDFIVDHLGFFGTAWLVIRISTQNNPSIDLKSGSMNGTFQLRFGLVVRVYTAPSTYTRKPTTNPAWVALDILTSKRYGVGYDFSRMNIQSFIDAAAHNAQTVTSTVDGSTVPRWTFNGVVDSQKAYQDWINLVCLGMYCTPPFLDVNGQMKIKVLAKADDLSAVPVFSSKDATSRAILWQPGPNGAEQSTLVRRRKKLEEIPNRIIVNYIAQDPAALNNPSFVTVDKALLNPKLIDTITPDFVKTQIVIDDNDAQRRVGDAIGDGSIRVVPKTYSFPGVTTLDEAVRLATLLLRAGEHAHGGLANNLQVEFKTFYDAYSSNLEPGDIIAVEDYILDPVSERYFRVTSMKDDPIQITAPNGDRGGILYIRTIFATLHDDSIYDDTGYTVTKVGDVVTTVPYDMWVPPVTNFSVAENGAFDANDKPISELTFTYIDPDPPQNFKDVVIMRSTDDGSGNPAGDWRFVTILTASPTTIQYDVTGNREHFTALSRSLSGTVPKIDTPNAAGSPLYPRYSVVIEGVTDAAVPDAPFIEIARSLAQVNSSRYEITFGVDSPASPANWHFIGKTEIQAASDSGFTGLTGGVGGAILDRMYNGKPPIQLEFATNYPGTYYFRARVENEIGWSAWSTVNVTSDALDKLSNDTDIMDGVTPTLNVQDASHPYIGGGETEATASVPLANSATAWGYTLILHDSSTLPSDTIFDSGTQGVIKPGSNILTDSTKSFGSLTNKTIRIFGEKRGGSPTFDGEGSIVQAKITTNDATHITFEVPSENMTRDLTGVSYRIMNVGNSWNEKVRYASRAEPYQNVNALAANRTVSARANVAFAPHYGWLVFYNKYGMGRAASAASATISGMSTLEIKTGAVTALKLTKNSQGWTTSVVFSASDYRTVAWSSGTLKTADGSTYSIASGNTGSMAALTYIYFDPTVSTTVLQVTTTYSNVTGENVILVCVAQNTADTTQNAVFIPSIGTLGINETVIGPNSISTGKIQASAITTNTIAANAVTATKISVSTLDAITVNAGTITAGTFIGTTFKTASSGARIEIDPTNGIRLYDSGGGLMSQLPLDSSSLKSNTLMPLGTGASSHVAIKSGDGNGIMFLNSGGFTIDLNGSGGVGVYVSMQTFGHTYNVDTAGNYEWDINNAAAMSLDATNFKVRIGGALRTISTFNDGLGHNVLYY